MERCREVEDWIQENVIQEIEQQERRCKKWPWPLSWLCSIVTFIVKVVVVVWTKIIRVVCEVVTVILNVIGWLVNLVLAIPIIGALVRAVIRLITWVASYVVGLIEGAARALGLRLTKRLRVHVIPLARRRVALAREQHLRPIMDQTADTLYQRAQIRVQTKFHEPIYDAPESSLRIGTDGDLILDEAWAKGSWFQLQANKLFEDNFARAMGIGHPVVVFIVEEVGYDGVGKVVGCSGGPFVDWVAVEVTSAVKEVVAGTNRPYPPTYVPDSAVSPTPNPNYQPYLIAHEICHALGLLGHANATAGDLMVEGTITGDALSPFQIGIIRNSAHVTFL